MMRPSRFELPTSCFGVHLSIAGARRISRLDVRLSATVGFIGQGWLVFVQPFVQLGGSHVEVARHPDLFAKMYSDC
jgi:hypothetical protein